MEIPDAKGFVNITWPSKSVPHGGIFHTRVVETSTSQKEFLKVLLDESRLTVAQRRVAALKLREQKPPETPPKTQKVPITRPQTSRRRSLSAIRDSGALEVDQYRPLKRGEDRDRLKQQLADMMTYGDAEQKQQTAPKVVKKPAPQLPTKKEQWHDLLTQIRERAEWLAEMEALGHAAPHRELVQDQIAERLRALDALGVDAQCSSRASTASGSSVLHSNRSEHGAKSVRVHSKGIEGTMRDRKLSKKKTIKQQKQEEHVAEYEKLSPLRYSPRRRV